MWHPLIGHVCGEFGTFTHRIKCDGYIYLMRCGELSHLVLLLSFFSLFFIRSSNLQVTISRSLKESSYLQNFLKFESLKSLFMAEEHHEDHPGEEGPVPLLRWDLGLFE
ncbi:hypothetical protein Hanom_Chr17g01533171 [Helianthus anomalus]